LFVSGGKLLSQPLNLRTAKLEWSAKILATDVECDPGLWHATFSATSEALVYRSRSRSLQEDTIQWFDLGGKPLQPAGPPGSFRGPRISPDGADIAASCGDPDQNICVIHSDNTVTLLTDEPISCCPVWSPDGTKIVYETHGGARRFAMLLKNLRARTAGEILASSELSLEPTSWSADGSDLLVSRTQRNNADEIVVFHLQTKTTDTYLHSNFSMSEGRFSPDGKWVTYQSDESGRNEVYVASYPSSLLRYLVSRLGGAGPKWSGDGRELYYLGPSNMIFEAKVTYLHNSLWIGPPQPLFEAPVVPRSVDSELTSKAFDASEKGRNFAMIRTSSPGPGEFVLVTHWLK
jgi:hypothetical protein